MILRPVRRMQAYRPAPPGVGSEMSLAIRLLSIVRPPGMWQDAPAVAGKARVTARAAKALCAELNKSGPGYKNDVRAPVYRGKGIQRGTRCTRSYARSAGTPSLSR